MIEDTVDFSSEDFREGGGEDIELQAFDSLMDIEASGEQTAQEVLSEQEVLVSPADQTGPHIQALARISRMMTDPIWRQKIWNSLSDEQLYRNIIEYEQKSCI